MRLQIFMLVNKSIITYFLFLAHKFAYNSFSSPIFGFSLFFTFLARLYMYGIKFIRTTRILNAVKTYTLGKILVLSKLNVIVVIVSWGRENKNVALVIRQTKFGNCG